MAADAADAADDDPRALITAAPRCCTVGMNVCLNQLSLTAAIAGLPSTVAWLQVRVLRGRVISPDDDFLDLRECRARLLAELRERAVVIETRHRREAIGRERRRVALGDQRIGVRRVADHEHTHVTARGRIERFALRGEDLGILEQQILALHARAARPRADQHGNLAVLEGDSRIVGRGHFVEREERAIVQLHHHALHRAERRRNLEQIQIDGLVGTEHLPGGDAKGERIPDVVRLRR